MKSHNISKMLIHYFLSHKNSINNMSSCAGGEAHRHQIRLRGSQEKMIDARQGLRSNRLLEDGHLPRKMTILTMGCAKKKWKKWNKWWWFFKANS